VPCFAFAETLSGVAVGIGMRPFGSAVTALIVLWLVDIELNHGHYSDVAMSIARELARSIGIR
jgi:hypothetical protein